MDVPKLVNEARTGNVDAFTTLVQRYQAMAFGYAYATTGDFDLAEDAAQQAFITAYRNLSRLRHPERFGGWLRGIVRFECLHLLRGRSDSVLPIHGVPDTASPQPGPVELADEQESLEHVLAAITALPEAERVSAILYYVHDYSQRDVATFLGLPVTTVNNRLRNARKRLRKGALVPMAKEAFRNHALPDDFAARIGEVVRAQGTIIDARFGAGQRPLILNEVTITDDATGLTLAAQVAQYLDDDLVRCLVLREQPHEQPREPALDGATLRPGFRVRDAAAPASLPMDTGAVVDVVRRMRGATGPGALLETGIKAVDLFCPLSAGSLIGLAGDMQSGKMVLVEELIHRLANVDRPLSVLVFVHAPAEVGVIQALEYRTSRAVEALYLPVADASPEALAPVTELLDGVITLSGEMGRQRLWPAIDPLRTTSRLLDLAVVGEEQCAIVARARELLRDEAGKPRAMALRRYLTQPFYVAEPFTNRAGSFVSRVDAIQDAQALLRGDHDAEGEALSMAGTIAEALGRG